MAIDKAVDSTQLDADLTSVANAIRTKGGTSASLTFPAGFVSAIGDIPSGGTDYLAQRCNGTITSYESNDVTSIADGTFRECNTLTSLKVYNCKTVTGQSLRNTKLQYLAFPGLTEVSISSFANLYSGYLKSLDLGPNCSEIKSLGFAGNSNFNTLILRRTSLVALNTSAFNSTPFANGGTGGTIYIPKSLYDHLGDGTSNDYKAATNWSTVNGYGTITWAKIEGSIYENAYADGTPIT